MNTVRCVTFFGENTCEERFLALRHQEQPLDTLFSSTSTSAAYEVYDLNEDESEGATSSSSRRAKGSKKTKASAAKGSTDVGSNLKILFGTLPAVFEID